MQLSESVRAGLGETGWNEDYRYDLEDLEERMRARGFELSPAVVSFLRRFGGLTLWREPAMERGTNVMFHTDPDKAPTHPSWIPEWEQAIGARVCPIGETGYGSFVLLMDEHGRVFGMNQEGTLSYWAETGDELLYIVFVGGGPRDLDEVPPLPLDKR